ncbi:ABC transporter ATP-binding protein [Achromobacter xylosoxidans]|uniref:ABC transporter ATP-binding protein n=1 Tax=Alcaligenes xylosoxydans xylosoxydans TaxID=85698 RepID=UPI0003321AFB|nr:ABC transporter ATP-binding protein [Achromobacter xylosoxidans]MEC6408412.1 ABC transporter ATP-binding protein [Achromobacter xylosoxidans]CCH05845.1 Oligopeptide transport ATP-binding protein OppD (TC 3.A.1.5.1 [Achromobacter xylosoxidans NH44784-1996]CUI82623.1 Glutathione import ATP-binding protein GsiA [Achromobacter xylosoxidans]CUI88207.1 Glutathione import ATP-binding protein GsiA [Achromobacter xylosoxidans]CUJ97110.1 Glutathione import ATP-binding protein GsiA [Achromobacter xylo
MSTLIDIQGLNVAFPGHQAVNGLDLRIAAGETLALVGESGCGKSTTALALLGLLPRHARASGRILFEGRDLLALSERQRCALRGDRIAMIFQEPMTSLNPVLTLGQQIGEALRLHRGASARAARQRAIELLDLVRVPEPQRRVDDYPHLLSGGQRQRAMIAAAIACEPALLVADEPTTALDVTVQAQILRLLDDLRSELGMGLLLITHDLAVVGDWADRVAVMVGGEKVEEGAAATLLSRPRHPYTRGLLGASLRLDDATHYRQRRLPEIRSRLDPASGRPIFGLVTPPRVAAANDPTAGDPHPLPLMQVRDLRVDYATSQGAKHAVDGVSFQIAPGETLGLVGESGCGKSTLSRTLVRLLTPAAGQILLRGQDTSRLDRRGLAAYRQSVQMIFQDPYASLNPRHTVNDILESALRIHRVADRQERRRRIAHMLDAVGLPQSALARYPSEFSGGQRQRIGIARALVLRPSLVICDEPVSALDVSVQAQILNLLVDLKAEFNLSYLFISHDLSVVHYLADRVLVMHAGRIVEEGPNATLWREARHPYTRSLIEALPRGLDGEGETLRRRA